MAGRLSERLGKLGGLDLCLAEFIDDADALPRALPLEASLDVRAWNALPARVRERVSIMPDPALPAEPSGESTGARAKTKTHALGLRSSCLSDAELSAMLDCFLPRGVRRADYDRQRERIWHALRRRVVAQRRYNQSAPAACLVAPERPGLYVVDYDEATNSITGIREPLGLHHVVASPAARNAVRLDPELRKPLLAASVGVVPVPAWPDRCTLIVVPDDIDATMAGYLYGAFQRIESASVIAPGSSGDFADDVARQLRALGLATWDELPLRLREALSFYPGVGDRALPLVDHLGAGFSEEALSCLRGKAFLAGEALVDSLQLAPDGVVQAYAIEEWESLYKRPVASILPTMRFCDLPGAPPLPGLFYVDEAAYRPSLLEPLGFLGAHPEFLPSAPRGGGAVAPIVFVVPPEDLPSQAPSLGWRESLWYVSLSEALSGGAPAGASAYVCVPRRREAYAEEDRILSRVFDGLPVEDDEDDYREIVESSAVPANPEPRSVTNRGDAPALYARLRRLSPDAPIIFLEADDYLRRIATPLPDKGVLPVRTIALPEDRPSYERLKELIERTLLSGQALRTTQADYLEDILSVQPGEALALGLRTGGGKSILFQGPALFAMGKRLSLVVSPLKALMKDQLEGLHDKLSGSDLSDTVAVLHGDQDRDEQESVYRRLAEGRLRLLYVSPERLLNPRFRREIHGRFAWDGGPGYLVFDEAHCVTQWGNGFRPAYLKAVSLLLEEFGDGPDLQAPMLLFSATLTDLDLADLVEPFGWRIRCRLETLSIRPEYSLELSKAESSRRLALVRTDLAALNPEVSSAAVFCRRRADTETCYKQWQAQGGPIAAKPFHARLSPEERDEAYASLKAKSAALVFCTKAFGLGVDIPNIHYVAHLDLPASVEDYLQEVGRAARDRHLLEQAGIADRGGVRLRVFANADDFSRLRSLVASSTIGWDQVVSLHEYVRKRRESSGATGASVLLGYYDVQRFSPGLRGDSSARLVFLDRCLHWLEKAGRVRVLPPVSNPVCVRVLATTGSAEARLLAQAYPLALEGPVTLAASDLRQVLGHVGSIDSLFTLLATLDATGAIDLLNDFPLAIVPDSKKRLTAFKNGDDASLKDDDRLALAACADAWGTTDQAFVRGQLIRLTRLAEAGSEAEGRVRFVDALTDACTLSRLGAALKALRALHFVRGGLAMYEARQVEPLVDGAFAIPLDIEGAEKSLYERMQDIAKAQIARVLALECFLGLGAEQRNGFLADYAKAQRLSALQTVLMRYAAPDSTVMAYLRRLPYLREVYGSRLLPCSYESWRGATRSTPLSDALVAPCHDIPEYAYGPHPLLSPRDHEQVLALLDTVPEGERLVVAEAAKEQGLTDEQLAVVHASSEKHILVDAGPGTGKTKTMLLRAIRILLYAPGSSPILILAFNRAVIEEIRDRARRMLSTIGREDLFDHIQAMTFHSFLLRYGEEVGFSKPERTPEKWEALFLDHVGYPYASSPKGLNTKFKHIFVDEFQDMSEDRYKNLKWLQEASGAAVTALGDRDQRIYSNENQDYFEPFARAFSAERYSLSFNFRSAPSVLEAASRIRPNDAAFLLPTVEQQAVHPDESGEPFPLVVYETIPDTERLDADILSFIERVSCKPIASIAVLFHTNVELVAARLRLRAQLPEGWSVLNPALRGASLEQSRETWLLAEALRDIEVLNHGTVHDRIAEIGGQYAGALDGTRLEALLSFCGSRLKDNPDITGAELSELLRYNADAIYQYWARYDSEGRPRKTITFSTIHAAKGLEYDAVFVAPAVSSPKNEINKGSKHAACRIRYVAATRAKKYLYLSQGPLERFEERPKQRDHLVELTLAVRNQQATTDFDTAGGLLAPYKFAKDVAAGLDTDKEDPLECFMLGLRPGSKVRICDGVIEFMPADESCPSVSLNGMAQSHAGKSYQGDIVDVQIYPYEWAGKYAGKWSKRRIEKGWTCIPVMYLRNEDPGAGS